MGQLGVTSPLFGCRWNRLHDASGPIHWKRFGDAWRITWWKLYVRTFSYSCRLFGRTSLNPRALIFELEGLKRGGSNSETSKLLFFFVFFYRKWCLEGHAVRKNEVRAHLRGWIQDLRVMVGDTSSYPSGEDTSKLVTPSEACWEGGKSPLK